MTLEQAEALYAVIAIFSIFFIECIFMEIGDYLLEKTNNPLYMCASIILIIPMIIGVVYLYNYIF